MFKHDASRVVQTAVKYGSAQRRQDIAKELKGDYLELAQSSYGKYLVVKLMHYGYKPYSIPVQFEDEVNVGIVHQRRRR